MDDMVQKLIEGMAQIDSHYGVAELATMYLQFDAFASSAWLLFVGLFMLFAAKKIMMFDVRELTFNELNGMISKSYGSRDLYEDAVVLKYTGSVSTKTVPEDMEANFVGEIPNFMDLVFATKRLPYTITAVVLGLIGALTLIKSINIWAWVGMFVPELYAAHRVLG